MQDVEAIAPVHRDAAAAGNVADDVVAGDGAAAAAELGEQVARAQHLDLRCRVRCLCRPLRGCQGGCFGGEEPFQAQRSLVEAELAETERGVDVVQLLVAGLA